MTKSRSDVCCVCVCFLFFFVISFFHAFPIFPFPLTVRMWRNQASKSLLDACLCDLTGIELEEDRKDFCLHVFKQSFRLKERLQTVGFERGKLEGVHKEPSLEEVAGERCSGWVFL